jgi:O-glycosyl hydrolase
MHMNMGSITAALVAVFAALQSVSAALPRVLPQRVTIQPRHAYQAFEGWGTSSAWWSQTIGDGETAEEIARALYSDTQGLGLDIYRYNVGGGENDNPATRIKHDSRRTESFYVYNPETGQYVYDFTRDANARQMLDKAIEQGATEVILFCCSPHFSMTSSGQASGGLEEGVSNLPPENYRAFVDYLLTIADWFVAQGYPVTGISPINEPQWGWGGAWVGQEGCHYTPEEAVALLELFAVTMKERGAPYRLVAPESGDMSEGYTAYTDAFWGSAILREYCGTFSGHSYWMDNEIVKKWLSGLRFKCRYPDKKFEMSEWCELPQTIDANSIDSGLYMANVIVQDLTLLNAVSWVSWTAVNGDGVMDIIDGQLRYYNHYWAYKQFSAFIREGAKRVKVKDSFGLGSDLSSVAFLQGGEAVLVVVNNAEEPREICLGGRYGAMQVYVTDAERRCELCYDGAFAAAQTLPARSIGTFVLAQYW